MAKTVIGINSLAGNEVGDQRKEKARGIGRHVASVADQCQRIGNPSEKEFHG